MMATPRQARWVCIKVPAPRTPRRPVYEALPTDPALRRQAWFRHCLGPQGVYVGRPKNDGGWYHVPEVKRGSLFANPYSLREYSLEESLRLFRAYLTARLSPGATIESLIPLFPTSQQQLLKERFIEGKSDKGKSVAHYDLTCLGDTFRARLEELAGRALGCWCTHGDQCHAGVLAEVVNSGAATAQPAQSRGSHRGKRGADALEGGNAGGGGGSTATKAKAIINFYSTKGEHGCFSNFYRAQFMLDGASWKTSEHYFQAQKFVGTKHEADVRNAASAGEAARMGRDRGRPLRKDWEESKVEVMEKALVAKFSQNGRLKDILLGTGNAVLVEHTAKDSYWGDGLGGGRNMLGKLLMKVRAQLSNSTTASAATSARQVKKQRTQAPLPVAQSHTSGGAGGGAGAGVASGSGGGSSSTTSGGNRITNYVVRTGDLLRSTEKYICQQCNCTTRRALGLSAAMFKKFPYANVYKSNAVRKPGTIIVRGGKSETLVPKRRVINMCGQIHPGRPRAPGSNDSARDRERYFGQCLEAIGRLKNVTSVAFPHKIGCGLAGGSWRNYEALLRNFAAAHPQVRVVVYKLPS